MSDEEAAQLIHSLLADSRLPASLAAACLAELRAAVAAWRHAVAAFWREHPECSPGEAAALPPRLLDVRLDVTVGCLRLTDRFLWDAHDTEASPEAFAAGLAADLGEAEPCFDTASLACEVALQVREALAAAWLGQPAAASPEVQAEAAAAKRRSPAERAAWAPRLEPLPWVAPKPPPPSHAAAQLEVIAPEVQAPAMAAMPPPAPVPRASAPPVRLGTLETFGGGSLLSKLGKPPPFLPQPAAKAPLLPKG